MKKFIAGILSVVVLFACEEDEKVVLTPAKNELQVALYGKPDVVVEKANHSGEITEVTLSYNRQVFVDLDAATDTENADTLGVHYNDDAYQAFDLWEDGEDVAEGFAGWDIVLTTYNAKLSDGEGGFVAYEVTGALVNKSIVSALKVNDANYDIITYEEAAALTLSEEVDAIGYNWKAFSFETYTYNIVEDQYYIIETTDGELFKLAFTGFYSEEGVGGFPKFKFERLIAE